MNNKAEKPSKLKEYTITATLSFGFPSTPYTSIRKTRKNRKKEIAEFMSHLEGFHLFSLDISLYPFSRSAKLGFGKPLSKEHIDNLRCLLECNEIMTTTIRLCTSEFLVFLSEIQTAAYSGAARTLRYILETAVEACGFELEKDRPTYRDLVEQYNALCDIPNHEKKIRTFILQHNARAQFMERYKIYERTKRIAPSFKELVNRLNSLELFREATGIVENLKTTYETLSDYVHPSLVKIERILEKEDTLIPRFKSESFDDIYELGLRTLDIVQFVYIKSMSHFLGFKDANEFLSDFAQIWSIPSKMSTSFLSLPFSKRLCGRINWKITSDEEEGNSPLAEK